MLSFPTNDTVYEYYVDCKRGGWVSWEEKISSPQKPPTESGYYSLMIPTVDTVRTAFISEGLIEISQHCMVVGNVGVGKTTVINSVLAKKSTQFNTMTINFSAQTSSNSLQVENSLYNTSPSSKGSMVYSNRYYTLTTLTSGYSRRTTREKNKGSFCPHRREKAYMLH